MARFAFTLLAFISLLVALGAALFSHAPYTVAMVGLALVCAILANAHRPTS